MGYKMDKVAKNFRKNLILFIIVWFVLTILFVAPMSIAIKQSTGVNGNFSFPIFIEHGSSDWSEGGEQYRILSKNKGIILAQKNYLPIGKRGNLNVLVVGRFWFW